MSVFCVGLLAAGCGSEVVNPVSGQTERTVMGEQQELAAGKEGHQEVLQEYGAYSDPKLQAYVEGVGQRRTGRRSTAPTRSNA